MIYYFSGTGNSRMVAEHLAELTNDTASSITSPLESDSDSIGLVFPVYAWGMPDILENFVKDVLPGLKKNCSYLYTVMTHGDDMGYADRILDKLLQQHCGKNLDAAFSVRMPNTYVCLPGFDIDSDELARKKVEETVAVLPDIARSICNKEKRVKVTRGGTPWLKSYVLRFLFVKFLVTDKYFRCDKTQCIQCRKCISTCPLHNISLEDDAIHWHGNCTGCLGCYHVCPKHAIHFGKMTKNKGQKQKSIGKEKL